MEKTLSPHKFEKNSSLFLYFPHIKIEANWLTTRKMVGKKVFKKYKL